MQKLPHADSIFNTKSHLLIEGLNSFIPATHTGVELGFRLVRAVPTP